MARESRLGRLFANGRTVEQSVLTRLRKIPSVVHAVARSMLRQGWPWWPAAGIVVVPFHAQLHPLLISIALLLTSLSWLYLRRFRALISIPVLFLFGITWGTAGGYMALQGALPQALIQKDTWVTGVIEKPPEARYRAQRIRFRIESLEVPQANILFSGRVLLNWYRPFPELQAGQRWRLKLRLKPAHGSLNPGGFNYEQWLFLNRIRATGYVRDGDQAELLGRSGGWLNVDRFRESVRRFIESQALDFGGVLDALAVGLRGGISQAQWRVLRNTGTAHLVAISGLHIGLVAGVAYFLGVWGWRHILLTRTLYPAQYAGRYSALLAALLYAALAGFSLPTLRALLMLVAYFLLQWLRRNPGTLFSLGFVLLAVVVFDPLAPLGSGFWLSFGAVAAIAWRLRPGPRQEETEFEGIAATVLIRRFRQWWQVQWAVYVGLLPLTLFFFQQVSLASLPANLIAIPLVSLLIVPLVLLAIVGFAINLPVVPELLLYLADKVFGWLWWVLQSFVDLPFSIWTGASPSFELLLLSVTGGVLLLTPAMGWKRLSGVLCFLPLFWPMPNKLENGAIIVHLLDVGQGLAVVVETRDHALLYDAGVKYPSGFDAGSAVVLPFLRKQQIDELDTVIASHDNLDHIGGIESVIRAFPGVALFSSAAFYPGSRACIAGQKWLWDGVQFGFVSPSSDNREAGNNQSCVLRVASPFGSVLLTGDIERRTEKVLLSAGKGGTAPVDLLLIPHHGSRSSSTGTFIDALKPALAILSSGYLNRFGHPHPQILGRYRERNIPVLNTANSGWIEVEFGPSGISARPWRAHYRRYWLGGSGSDDLILSPHSK